jgi:hypothetical protein
LKVIVDILNVFSEFDHVLILINLLESIQKMVGNIANILDLRFIYLIIIRSLLPTIRSAQIYIFSRRAQLPLNLPHAGSLLLEDVSLSKYHNPYISIAIAGSPTAASRDHSATDCGSTTCPYTHRLSFIKHPRSTSRSVVN